MTIEPADALAAFRRARNNDSRPTGSHRTRPHHRSNDMPRAIWNDTTVAESDDTVVVEGNHYFPADSLDGDLFRPSDRKSVCPWKGEASYYDVVVDGEVNPAAAWYYPTPKPEAAEIAGRVAFWHGVQVDEG
jgi:uncharacterized protein (DUF427 family)